MKMLISALVALVPMISMAQAPQAIDGAVVLRVDTRDNSLSIATTEQKLKNEADAQTIASKLPFAAVPAENQLGELDRENGASSWYCYYPAYYNPYYRPNLYWYGNYYQPYYSYSYSYYSYYYYNSYGWWGW